MLQSLSVDEILLPRYVKWLANLPLVKMGPIRLKQMVCLICVHVKSKISCCFIQSMQQEFNLGRGIANKSRSSAYSVSVMLKNPTGANLTHNWWGDNFSKGISQ